MISRKVIKAVEAAVLVASRTPGKPVTVKEMSDTLGMSVGYLEVLVRDLREHGLLVAHRGPGGGYQFNAALFRDPRGVSLWDVVRIYQEPEDADPAPRPSDAFAGVEAALHDSFRRACQAVSLLEVASSIDLASPRPTVAEGPFKLKPLPRPMLPHGVSSVFQWARAAVPEPA
ncbi:Rrf2 family transcriptional regulator [Malikia sp.]|uniref:RrF2 family transcriptional regulator n=1 Tax=Malikia sp. TaxID=2070706 RepID=UPI002606A0ED|nr:Rrf2 family transcriptional regulator [Malikia sp.]MDD2728486.1 Rrf2 family transcriptional regulator [Malikia sp.]